MLEINFILDNPGGGYGGGGYGNQNGGNMGGPGNRRF